MENSLKELVLATANPNKVEELRSMMESSGITLKIRARSEFDGLEEVVEDENTLHGNAVKKAKYLFEETEITALADDTGLEVDALNGEPGVFSARYAGENASYEDNVNKLLKSLSGQKNRKARFRTVLAMVSAYGTFVFEGVCEGEITTKPAGKGGFGYDPVFLPNGYPKTFAELDPVIKNTISHRGRAFKKWLHFISQLTKAESKEG
ncbi:MAG: RdgB/HAM1 family non-canonical purine NTP pyrophosphatase [Balneolales bacterium]|nr:RdgB/HAM1 family non-canonical purine NTP pyrophosphatase [Balneolales bacterium]